MNFDIKKDNLQNSYWKWIEKIIYMSQFLTENSQKTKHTHTLGSSTWLICNLPIILNFCLTAERKPVSEKD